MPDTTDVNDLRTIALVAGVLLLLSVVTGVGQFLKRHPDRGIDAAAVRTFNLRIRGWWVLCTVLAAAFWLGSTATVTLFGLVSFWALREFITLTPTRKGDHRALFWVFFLFTPLHYVLVGLNRYDIYSVFLPVYATLFVLAREVTTDRIIEHLADHGGHVLRTNLSNADEDKLRAAYDEALKHAAPHAAE